MRDESELAEGVSSLMGDRPGGREEITQLLARWGAGESEALDRLVPLVFQELRRLARWHLAREGAGHTLEPTALVHEVYLRLLGDRTPELGDRTQFFAFASRLIRHVLVDHARAKRAVKRGGLLVKTELDEGVDAGPTPIDPVAVLDIHRALERLEALDPRQGRLAELRYFGGLTVPEAAEVLGISRATAERAWSVARRWLARELRGPANR